MPPGIYHSHRKVEIIQREKNKDILLSHRTVILKKITGITFKSYDDTVAPFNFKCCSSRAVSKYELRNHLRLRGKCFQSHSKHSAELILHTYVKTSIAIPKA